MGEPVLSGDVLATKERYNKNRIRANTGGRAMTYGYITVTCPRCNSRIEIISGSVNTEIFYCPVCQEGEIHNKTMQLAMQPVSVLRKKKPKLEQYITTLSNVWAN
jgi:hypothetical protein